MERIALKKDGLILKNEKPWTRQPLELLGSSVTLDKDFSLASFFFMIQKYPELKIINEFIDTYLEMIPDYEFDVTRSDEISGLIFYKTIEIIGFPGTPSLQIYNSLKGCLPGASSKNKQKPAEMKDLKFLQLESLLGHNLALGKLQHIVFGDQQDVFRYDTFYTFFELVEGIAWELSFNFNPLQCSIRR